MTSPTARLHQAMMSGIWRERLTKPRKVLVFDGTDDPEVCCAVCGAFLGRNSSRWWDDYTCIFCHDTH